MITLFNDYGGMLLKAIGVHTIYVLIAAAVGFVFGVLIGILLSRIPKLSGIIMPILSIFQTIPGLVFIGVLFIWWGDRYLLNDDDTIAGLVTKTSVAHAVAETLWG